MNTQNIFSTHWFRPITKKYLAFPVTWEGYMITSLIIIILIWRAFYAQYDPYLFIFEIIYGILIYGWISNSKKKL
ncbi:MAG: hypothetical protein ACMXYA_01975 [Candidatus Woesearchaeota archaeon]